MLIQFTTESQTAATVLKASASEAPSRVEVEIIHDTQEKEQYAGIWETIVANLDPFLAKALIGVAAIAGGATLKKGAELVTEDFYKWLKKLMRKTTEEGAELFDQDKSGITFYFRAPPDTDDVRPPVSFVFRYEWGDKTQGKCAKKWDNAEFDGGLSAWELVCRPILSALIQNEGLVRIEIRGLAGPASNNREWEIALDTKRRFLQFFVKLNGTVDWGDDPGFTEDSMVKVLSPLPFVVNTDSKVVHWRTCRNAVDTSRGKTIEMRSIEDFVAQGYTYCGNCMARVSAKTESK